MLLVTDVRAENQVRLTRLHLWCFLGLVMTRLVGCDGAEGPDAGFYAGDAHAGGDVVFTIPDMRTGVDSASLNDNSVRAGVRLTSVRTIPDAELSLWDGALRMVRWPSGEIVPGSWAYDRGTGIFHFGVAGAQFGDGWFAVQADLDRVGRRAADRSAPIVDGWWTSRFRVGSQPLARISYSLARTPPDSNSIEITCSEDAAVSEVRRFSEHVEVTVDGEPRACAAFDERSDTFGPSPLFEGPRTFYYASLECGFIAEGALVEVRMVAGFTDMPLTDYRGVSPPRWTFRVGEDPETTPADVLFERDAP